MIRKALLFSLAGASLALTGCGDTANGLLDALPGFDFGLGGQDGHASEDLFTGDMVVKRLTTGVWKVVNDVTIGNDGCQVNPNDPANPTKGQIFALQNDGAGVIKLGNPTDPTHPSAIQQYDGAESGTPPQPAQGASCPGTNNPAQCATELTAVPFNADGGTLVRDNTVGTGAQGTCTFHRHLVNQVALTGDRQFTAQYTRTDTQHVTCTQTTDCTTTWSWDFVFVKGFGQ